MIQKIGQYWNHLSKKYSNNQVFFVLSYWLLTSYLQVDKGCGSKEDLTSWRQLLIDLVRESLSYDVKEAAVRLSERIEWTLLEMDEDSFSELLELSYEVEQYLRMTVSDKNEIQMEKQQLLMGELFKLASVNMLYSATPVSIMAIIKGIASTGCIDNMLDLCCGNGGLGISVWQQMKKKKPLSYKGIDIEPVLCDICTMMTYICGMRDCSIVWQDVLGEYVQKDTFDLVLLDAPRGQNKTMQIQKLPDWIKGIKQKNIYADWLYMLRGLDALNDEGKGIAVVTSGALLRKNETEIRKLIMSNDWIEAVITLPVNLYANSRIGSEIIVFNKAKEKKRKKSILFIDITQYYYRDSRYSYAISEEGISRAIEIYHKFQTVDGISKVVKVEEIDKETASLKPLRYIEAVSDRNVRYDMLHLKDVASVMRGVQLRKDEEEYLCSNGYAHFLNIKDINDGIIHYSETKMISPKSEDWNKKFAIKEDDILITSKGTTLKIVIVQKNPPETYICGNLTLIRVDKEKYHPYVLYEYLCSKEGKRTLESIQSGTTIRILNNANLEKLEIPEYKLDIVNKVGEQLKEKKSRYEQEQNNLKNKYETERKVLLELIGLKE